MGLPRSNWAHWALRPAPLPSEPPHLALNVSFSRGVLPTRDRFSFPGHFPGVPSLCTTRTAGRLYQCCWTEYTCKLKCRKTLWIPQCFGQHIVYLAFLVLFIYFCCSTQYDSSGYLVSSTLSSEKKTKQISSVFSIFYYSQRLLRDYLFISHN